MNLNIIHYMAHGGVIGAGFWRYDITTALTLNINEDKTYARIPSLETGSSYIPYWMFYLFGIVAGPRIGETNAWTVKR